MNDPRTHEQAQAGTATRRPRMATDQPGSASSLTLSFDCDPFATPPKLRLSVQRPHERPKVFRFKTDEENRLEPEGLPLKLPKEMGLNGQPLLRRYVFMLRFARERFSAGSDAGLRAADFRGLRGWSGLSNTSVASTFNTQRRECATLIEPVPGQKGCYRLRADIELEILGPSTSKGLDDLWRWLRPRDDASLAVTAVHPPKAEHQSALPILTSPRGRHGCLEAEWDLFVKCPRLFHYSVQRMDGKDIWQVAHFKLDVSSAGSITAIGHWWNPKEGLLEPYRIEFGCRAGRGLLIFQSELLRGQAAVMEIYTMVPVAGRQYVCGMGLDTSWGNPEDSLQPTILSRVSLIDEHLAKLEHGTVTTESIGLIRDSTQSEKLNDIWKNESHPKPIGPASGPS